MAVRDDDNRFDFYYHIDTTHESFSSLTRDQAKTEHNRRAPGTELGIHHNAIGQVDPSASGAEAIMKIRTKDGTYSPDWERTVGFVIRKYSITEKDQMFADIGFHTPDWNPED